MKRLNGFSLLESLIAIVLLSTLFSISLLITYRLFGSQADNTLQLRAYALHKLDSALTNRLVFPQTFYRDGLTIHYDIYRSSWFMKTHVMTCKVSDNYGRDYTVATIVLADYAN